MANDLAGDALEQLPALPAPKPIAAPPAPAVVPAAVKEPAAEDYAAMFAEQDQGNKQRLRTSLVQTADQAPDRAAEVRKLSQQTGVAEDIVGRNFDSFKRTTPIEQAPLTEMVRDTPHLATWAADPKNAAVSHDDMDKLGALEWLVSMPSRAISQSLNEQAYGALRTKSIFQPLTQAETDQLAAYKLHATMGGELGAGNSWFKGALTKTMKLLTSLTAPEFIPTVAGATMGGVIGGAGGFMVAGPAGVLPGAAAVGKLGAEAGYTFGLGQSAFQTSAGAAYDEYLATTDNVGRKLDPEVAKALAVMSGAINAGLMTLGGGVIKAGIEATGKKVAANLSKDVIAQALKQPSVVAALGDMVKGYGVTLTEGTALMVAMKAANIITGSLARSSGERAPTPGQVEPGNINLYQQPVVQNADGSHSTVDSFSVNIDGKEVLLPTVTPDGRHLDQAAALKEYETTGRHLGKFDSPTAADAFATQLHEDYAAGKYSQPSIARQLLDAAAEGVQSFAIIGAAGPAMGLAREFSRAQRAQRGQMLFEALGEGVTESKTHQRLPEAVQAFVEKATKDGPIATVYAPVEEWSTYWQGKGVDPAAMAAELTGDPKAFENAQRTGEDLAIPTSRYAAKLAGTEHNGFFSQELRLGPDMMNGRESTALIEKMKAEADQAEAVKPEAGTPVRQAVMAQLEKAGITGATAEQYATLFETSVGQGLFGGGLGERAGELGRGNPDLAGFYAKYGLDVSAPDLAPAGEAGAPVATGEKAVGRQGELVDASGAPLGGYAGPERRTAVEQAAGELKRRASDQPVPHMAELIDGLGNAGADIVARAKALKAENPNIEREALAARRRAESVERVKGPKGRQKKLTPEERQAAALVDNKSRAEQNPQEYLNAGNLEARTSEPGAPAPEGRGPGDAAGQRAGADVARADQAGGDGGVAQPGRLPTPAIPELDETFSKPDPADTERRLTPAVSSALAWIVDELATFPKTEDTWQDLSHETAGRGKSGNAGGGDLNLTRGIAGAPVYHDVLAFSPMNRIIAGKKKGEVAERAHGSRAKVEAAIRSLIETGTVTNNLQEGALRVAENRVAENYRDLSRPALPPPHGIVAERAFTDALSKAIDQAGEPGNMLEAAGLEQDAIDTGVGDTSFNIEEFSQSLFDELEAPDPVADTLVTGEQQPRLPGDVGAVREADVKTPAFEAPFSLTSEAATRTGKQTTLFQDEKVTQPTLDEFAAKVKDRIGPDLARFELALNRNGDIALEWIVVDRGAQRAGVGTQTMQELTRYADRNGRRLVLSPAEDGGETRATLVKFYKKFGFVENTGNDRDLSIKAGMYREPTLPSTSPEAKAQARDPRELMIQHNLTEANLLQAGKMGGLAVPSLAITKAGDPLVNFGEVTLIGPREMADPKGYAKTRVFGADVYSPRYPTIHYKIDRAGEKKLGAIVKDTAAATGRTYFDLDTVQKEGAKGLEDEPAIMAAFLKAEGVELPAPAQRKDNTGIDSSATRYALRDLIDESDARRAKFKAFAAETFASLEPTERIYRGYTNSGNPSYKPHTLENVVAILKQDIRGGESSSNIYGVGQLRARFTPEFRSLKGIRDAASLLTDDASFEKVKKDVEGELFKITDALKSSYTAGSAERFGFVDTVMAVMEDTPKKGLTAALKEYGFTDVPADDMAAVVGFITKLKNLPTEYFEAKILREVDLAEFAAAVVPDNLTPEARQVLEARGVPIEEYKAGNVADRQRVIDELTQREADKILFQDEKADKRGAIRFGPDRQFNINLLERADLSTFLHESGHFFLEVFGDVADRLMAVDPSELDAQQRQILADYGTTLAHLGVENRAELGREHHETFARSFEAYLMEGQAPAPEMRTAFARFRAWLTGIYRSLTKLNVKLTPEVRGVMDRLLASDQAIKDAQAERGVEAMFTTPESAGMDPHEFSLYAATVADASKDAREKLDAKLMAEVAREQKREWKEQRANIRSEVEGAVHQRPEYQALAAMRRGEHPDGSPLIEGLETAPLVLSRELLEAKFGKERVNRLPADIVSKEHGVDPELVAGMFGYSSADEMLTAVEKAPAMRDVIERETKRRMIEAHGSILLDGTLHEKAKDAVANETRDEVIRAEMRALGRLRRQVDPFVKAERAKGADALAAEQAERAYERRWFDAEAKLRVAKERADKQEVIDGLTQELRDIKAQARGGAKVIRDSIPDAAILRAAADARISAMRIGDIRPQVFWWASRKAAQQAIDHAARQNFDGAITAKQQELINLNLYRRAEAAVEDIEARVRFAKGLGTTAVRKTLGFAGASYLDQVDGVLDRYEFAKVSGKVLERRAGLRNWIAALEAQGLPADGIPVELLEDAQRRNYKELTVDELVGVTDGIKQILHLARLKNKLLKAAERRDFEEVRDGIATSIDRLPKRGKVLEFRASDDTRRAVSEWFASHTKLSMFIRALDSHEDGGAMWEAIGRPINEAGDAEAARKQVDGERYAKVLEAHYPGRELGTLHEKLFIPEIGGSLSKEARLAVALNWGNETSRDRLVNDPTRGWKAPQIEAILGTLDARDWRFVQDTFDFVNTYWDEIAAKQERVTGLAPEKVEALPIQTKFGEVAGGYYPLAYDNRLSVRVGQNELASQSTLAAAGAYVRSTTKRGHVEARKANVKLPIRLELGVMFQHVDQVIHDLTHHEMLIDVTRLVRDPKVSQAIINTKGDIAYRQITGALQDIAVGSGQPAKNMMDRAANFMRTGTQLSMLGWNVWTSLQQPLGVFNGMQRVGVGYVARGMTRWLRDAASMQSTTKWIADNSPMMRERTITASQDLSELRGSIRQPGGWFDTLVRKVSADHLTQQAIVDGYLWHIGLAQRVADVPTWLGMYEKAMEHPVEGRTPEEHETRAFRLADQAVLDSQGGGQIKDLAQVQRGGPIAKLFMTFYSYGNTIFNATADAAGQVKSPADVLTFLGHMSLLYVLPALGTVTLSRISGRSGGVKDTVEKFAGDIGKEMLSTGLNTMVLVRELGGLVQDGTRGYAGPAGARVAELLYNVANQVKQGEADAALFKATNAAAGVLFRYPALQVQRTIDGYMALQDGRTKNPGALLVGAPPKNVRK